MITPVKFIVGLTIIGLTSCGQVNKSETNATWKKDTLIGVNQAANPGDYPWPKPNQFTPVSFIDAVTIKHKSDTLLKVYTVVDHFPDDWIKSDDLDTLISMLGSTKKCACFLNPLSSYLPTRDYAEVGGYAAIFIEAYKQQKRVKLGLYACPKTNQQTTEELMTWWTNEKENIKKPGTQH